MKRPKDKYIVFIIAGGAMLLSIGATLVLVGQILQPKTHLQLGDGVFDARVAKTDAERQNGLGGQTNLGESDALLMVYSANSKWPIWMKDMKIPIDIVWLDSNKKVVSIDANVPASEGEDVVHTPSMKARYVVELAAGTAQRKVIHEGLIAAFDAGDQEAK
jgi:uncharacterized membrane protein (UPF0127 family)